MTDVIKDLSYSTSGIESLQNNSKCKLDLYIPQSNSQPTQNRSLINTVLVFFHGGSWRSGDKSEYFDVGNSLSNRTDCIVAICNYRLSLISSDQDRQSNWLFPIHLKDVQQALCKIIDYGIESNLYSAENIFLIGHSAGAHLISMLTISNSEEFEELESRQFSKRIRGCICVGGVYDLPRLVDMTPSYIDFVEQAFGIEKENWRLGSPSLIEIKNKRIISAIKNTETEKIGYSDTVDSKFKFFVVHGKQDELVNEIQATQFVEKLKIENINASLEFLENGDHFAMLHTQEFVSLVDRLVKAG